jgi:hypothetical protein
MIENPSDEDRVFDTGDHLDGAAALLAGFDVDIEYASSSKADVGAFVPSKCRIGCDPPMV